MTTMPAAPLSTRSAPVTEPAPHRSRRRWSGVAAVVVVLTSLVSVAGAQTPEELREQRQEVQAEAAAKAIEVDTAEGDAAEVRAALEALQASVDAQEASLRAAQRRLEEADAARVAAEIAVADLRAEQQALEGVVRDAAVEAFVNFQSPAGTVDPLGADPISQARDEALVEFAAGSRLDAVDELRSVGAELAEQQRLAEEAEEAAAAAQAEVTQRLAELAEARDQQAALVADAESRLDARLAEAAALQSLDADLAAEIEAEEQRIAAEIAARQQAEAEAQAQAQAQGTGSGSGGSSSSSAGTGSSPIGPVSLTSVNGITVASSIAGQLRGLLDAMAAEGFVLGGGGYRSSDSQIALRRAHCGTSDYAIYEMPASQCSPPTARPGQSAHEQGLAVDFTYGGSIISSRSSAVFQALARVAPSYGFINLPSEPWHWSTTGR